MAQQHRHVSLILSTAQALAVAMLMGCQINVYDAEGAGTVDTREARTGVASSGGAGASASASSGRATVEADGSNVALGATDSRADSADHASGMTIPDDSPVADALRKATHTVDAIVAIPAGERTFPNTLGALDDMRGQLELDTNWTMFMAFVSTDAAERERGLRAEQDVTNWGIELGQREDLYRAVQAYAEGQARRASLDAEQKRLLEHTLRDFRRAGMALPVEQREKLAGIQKEISRLGIDFEKNIREDETSVPLTRTELAGMSDEFVDGLDRSGDLYLLDMSYPQFNPIMDLCDDETTREKVWVAYKRRGGAKNVAILERIIELRAEASRMLGYPNSADYEIEVRMAKKSAEVEAFFSRLRPLVREKAQRDWDEFVAAKREHTSNADATLEPWDLAFYKNRFMESRYAVDSEKVREYFPLARVIDGLFSITQSLYGLEYKEVSGAAPRPGWDVWHEDARLFEVYDRADSQLIGYFFIDLHPRDNKYNHAAQWGLAQHKVWQDGRVTKPIAALVCNFTKPTATKPSLMTHDEVETFFHEFGHCLHTILSEGRMWRFSGTGVERDFVEAPSQMFENWVWDRDVLATFARHYETNEPFPSDLLDGLLRARYLASGLLAEHQFYYGLMDLRCHTEPSGKVDTVALSAALWDRDGVELFKSVPETWYHAGFGHFVGYQAGYYGYQWSLVYACDMFQRFRELGMLDPEAGMYYRKKILARGGTLDGLDLVRDYLGREPEMEPYLEHLGLEVE